ncbi:MAG: hypothetical protein HQM09_02035 [Candidatus Riflebacteria bacterium]|nr:hypothetical protein [Candidatus Riflebacteria bacterium]
MADKAPASSTVPQTICPSCKAPNDMGTLMCKKCGDILPAKKGKGAKGGEEYDATAGTLSPTCIAIPIVVIVLILAILFFMFRGPKAGTCASNIEKIGIAVTKYDHVHKDSKMTTLDIEALLKPDSKGKSFLKERPVCPVDSTAVYSINSEGKIVCSHKGKK